MAIPSTDYTRSVRAYRAFSPVDQAAGSINGVSIDRSPGGDAPLALSGKLSVIVGAASGSPTAQSVTCVMQESTDNSTWTALYEADGTTQVAITALTADDGIGSVDFQLNWADRYIRAVPTVAFTAGTTPAIEICGVITLGGFDELPHGG